MDASATSRLTAQYNRMSDADKKKIDDRALDATKGNGAGTVETCLIRAVPTRRQIGVARLTDAGETEAQPCVPVLRFRHLVRDPDIGDLFLETRQALAHRRLFFAPGANQGDVLIAVFLSQGHSGPEREVG